MPGILQKVSVLHMGQQVQKDFYMTPYRENVMTAYYLRHRVIVAKQVAVTVRGRNKCLSQDISNVGNQRHMA